MIVATVPAGLMQVGVIEWLGAYARVFDLHDGRVFVLPAGHMQDFVSINELDVVLLLNTSVH